MSGPENETPQETPAKKTSTRKTSTKATPAQEPGQEPGQQPAQEPGPAGPSQTAQATAAASAAVSNVREKLVAGEQFVLAAAGSIVLIVYLLFEFLLDFRIVGQISVLLAVLTILAIWVHRWGHYDFGTTYRIVVAGLALSLTLLALMNLLAWARLGGGSGDFLGFIGRLIYWASAVAAGYGGWLVFRIRED